MSKVNHAPVCFPPQFPVQGRLPSRSAQVQANILRQSQQERDYHDALCVAAGRRVMPPCSKTLHISLCFDGTGNNLNNDLYESAIAHPTNIARLFRASIGDGHAGGTSHRGSEAQGLTDAAGTGYGQYYKYYMPGVGTPFPEVNDLDYSSAGLALASRGEERVNWGLLMIIDALRRCLELPRLDNEALQQAVKAMGTWHGTEWATGRANRAREFHRQLYALFKPLRIALTQPQPGRPKLLGIKLYVYGFSRGAAAARAFVNWLNQLLSRTETTPTFKLLDLKLPVSVEYLGLLDTVVSVGIADITPGATGHMGWGDGSQVLPSGQLVKRCLHIAASHEQRLCFPLDSIRREDGSYPDNSEEVIYPGVHSDQGGGYPPGDQGKAIGENDGLLLSQIALHDMYADAFAHGAPLKVPESVLPEALLRERWRAMEPEVVLEFIVAPTLVNRFNAWREVTLGFVSSPQRSAEQSDPYLPISSNLTLEESLREQLGWITAWRIDRYAFATLKNTPFYRQASDTHGDDHARAAAEAERNRKQLDVKSRRIVQRLRERQTGSPMQPLEPGVKDFDPDKAQTQLREAAEEFSRIYRDLDSDPYVGFFKRTKWLFTPSLFTLWNSIDTLNERQQLKATGQARVGRLFPPPRNEQNHVSESNRGNVDESRNAQQPEGLLRALFDDQVHDSRAWFFQAMLNATYLNTPVAAGREPWGSYFNERMVFFGDADRRELALSDQVQAPTVAGTNEAPVSMPAETEAQHMARIQQAIAARWETFYASLDEVNDAQS